VYTFVVQQTLLNAIYHIFMRNDIYTHFLQQLHNKLT